MMPSSLSGSQLVASPHAHAGKTVTGTMLRVELALVPATLFSFWLYGWPSFLVWALTLASCAGFEALCLRLKGHPQPARVLKDHSALLTGWLLALTLPPWAPWWVPVLGGFIAIVIGKQVFGGLGQNVFNPAMVARVALLVSFPLPLTTWVLPGAQASLPAPGLADSLMIFLGAMPIPDAMASASPLGFAKTELSRGMDLLHSLSSGHAPLAAWHGVRVGSLGESAAPLLLAGGLYLIAVRIISWHIPLAVLAGLAIPAAIGHAANPAHYLDAATHLLSGAAILGAFFIATDYVTSPTTPLGKLLFGLGIGLLTWIIRTWGGYPEGMAFAVLFMNALAPMLDRAFKPRILGRQRNGKPLDAPKEA